MLSVKRAWLTVPDKGHHTPILTLGLPRLDCHTGHLWISQRGAPHNQPRHSYC